MRSTLNTGYITALDMCEVCTEEGSGEAVSWWEFDLGSHIPWSSISDYHKEGCHFRLHSCWNLSSCWHQEDYEDAFHIWWKGIHVYVQASSHITSKRGMLTYAPGRHWTCSRHSRCSTQLASRCSIQLAVVDKKIRMWNPNQRHRIDPYFWCWMFDLIFLLDSNHFVMLQCHMLVYWSLHNGFYLAVGKWRVDPFANPTWCLWLPSTHVFSQQG